MILEAGAIIGKKVLHFDSGEPLAILNSPIVNPDTGVIEGFWVKPLALGIRDAVIQTADIVEFKKNVYVKSDHVIADPDDIIRIGEMLSEERWLLGARVENEAGHVYGICINLSFSLETYMVRQIYVERKLMGLLTVDRRVFGWDRILKILPEAVIVDDSTEDKEAALNDVAEPAAG